MRTRTKLVLWESFTTECNAMEEAGWAVRAIGPAVSVGLGNKGGYVVVFERADDE